MIRRGKPLAVRSTPIPHLQHGVGLVEMMAAVVISLLAVLVIYQVFAVSEGYRRNTAAASNAQQSGLISLLTVGIELANAGNAVSLAAAELSTCPNTGDPATTLRPIPVLVIAGASDAAPDSMVVSYSTTRGIVAPVPFLATTAAGGNSFAVQSPTGFAVGNRVIAVKPSTGTCMTSVVIDRSPKMAPLEPVGDKGRIDLTVLPSAATEFNTDSLLLDVGPAGGPQRTLFELQGAVLQSTDLLTAGAAASPLAANVVNMKVLYGIDTSVPPDDIVDNWVPATGAWTRDSVLAASLAKLTQIKAIRIGLIVRSDQYDRDITGATAWTLFDCPTHDTTCPGRITGILPANWRYRTYETVIPLRNQLWNGTPS